MKTSVVWKEAHVFDAEYPGGEHAALASVPGDQRPGPGPSPMDMVQAAVAGCTGIDVVMILDKMRKTLDGLRIEVEATRRDEVPKIFSRLELTYYIDGADIDEAAAKRAVSLSQEKYCSVSAMIQDTVQLDYRIILNGRELEAASQASP